MTEQAAPAAADPVAPADGVTPGGDESGSGDDIAAIRRALDEERKQRKAFERQLRELSTAREQADAAKKSDVERLTAELAKREARVSELEQAARARDVRDAVVAAAERAGARKPISVFKLLADDLKVDDETGLPTNVKDLIDSLKKSDPELFRTAGSADGAARGVAPSAGADMNAILRRAAGRG